MARILPNRDKLLRTLLLTPSFYGLLTWIAAFLMYIYGPLPWDTPSPSLWILFFLVFACYVLSLSWSIGMLGEHGTAMSQNIKPGGASQKAIFRASLVLHALGFVGVAWYVRDFGSSLGDLSSFSNLLMYEAYKIRQETEVTTSYGFQLSYFGWVGIVFSLFVRPDSFGLKVRTWGLITAQFMMNLLFIDRTRPTWILFSIFIAGIFLARNLKLKTLLLLLAGMPAFFVILFVMIGGWIGKTDFSKAFLSDDSTSLLEGPIYYSSCGFAYLNWAADHLEPSRMVAERTLYPLYRLWAIFEPSKQPLSQINEFVNVPMPTNVGTFLEPFIRDGGLIFAIFGAMIHSFVFDFFAFLLRKQATPTAVLLLSNLCFTDFIGFFTPKINTFPLWFFFGLWLLSRFIALFVVSYERR